jgi:hypothetical protein
MHESCENLGVLVRIPRSAPFILRTMYIPALSKCLEFFCANMHTQTMTQHKILDLSDQFLSLLHLFCAKLDKGG